MSKEDKIMNTLNILIIFLLLIVTISGVCSFDKNHTYEIVNQYGENIMIWGAGVYAHDSLFKAPIFIGSDFTMLLFIVPLYIVTFWKLQKKNNIENYIQCFGILSLILYYSASLALGVTYNYLHLIYIILFGMSFYGVVLLFTKLHTISILQDKKYKYEITKGTSLFLVISGISLFIAWMPDIVSSLIKGTSLELIEVYTTEITYVLDIGIISPLMFISLYLVKQKKFIGYVLLRMILRVCMGVGIMLPIQTVFQLFSGISIPIPAIITKVLIFVMLALFAVFFEHKMKENDLI